MSVDSDVIVGKCPFCGSAESFRFSVGQKRMFLCHDCQRYVSESTLPSQEPVEMTRSYISFNSLLTLCTKLTSLPSDHLCVQYVKSRGIPEKHWGLLYYTERFQEIAKTIDKETDDSPRLVLPFLDNDGNLFAIQGRALKDVSRGRYVTLVFDKSQELLFGKDRVDLNKPFVVVEGPIDSLFLENAVATAGVGDISDKYLPHATICLDNEPRNKDIVRIVKKNLERGFKVVIWPDSVHFKDINDMVLHGVDVGMIISEHTFKGMQGILKLNSWKKV